MGRKSGRKGTPQIAACTRKIHFNRVQSNLDGDRNSNDDHPVDACALFSPILTERSSWETMNSGANKDATESGSVQVDVQIASDIEEVPEVLATPPRQVEETSEREVLRDTPTVRSSSKLHEVMKQGLLLGVSPTLVASPAEAGDDGDAYDMMKPEQTPEEKNVEPLCLSPHTSKIDKSEPPRRKRRSDKFHSPLVNLSIRGTSIKGEIFDFL